ncbi:MAG: hypothetical protein EXS05_17965 [Planctomycetaceae bacterium]|nr:hypothetical protein [Planctomycetaceae bacterium]
MSAGLIYALSSLDAQGNPAEEIHFLMAAPGIQPFVDGIFFEMAAIFANSQLTRRIYRLYDLGTTEPRSDVTRLDSQAGIRQGWLAEPGWSPLERRWFNL